MRKLVISSLLLLTICPGCSQQDIPAPIYDAKNKIKRAILREESVVVSEKDTLYGISQRVGIHYKELAAINDIRPPYTIHKGQKLRLAKSASVTKSTTSPIKKVVVSASAKTGATKTPAKAKINPNEPSASEVKKYQMAAAKSVWLWPAKGSVAKNFANKYYGIDITGVEGAPIVATRDGQVVYSGDGLRGYGNLIIIKHEQNFLTAYAHNRKNIVKEGEKVVSGQRIAEMGHTGCDKLEPKLHFQVRVAGRPIDPLTVLQR